MTFLESQELVASTTMGWTRLAPRRVCFFLNAQVHQVLHVVPIAIEMSRDPRFTVCVLAATQAHIDLARRLVEAAQAGPIQFEVAGGPRLQATARMTGSTIPPKLLTLAASARRLAQFDAIVVPERTSLLLRHLGVRRPLFVHTAHGAGDRAVGYDKRIRQFDFALVAGEKQQRRMLDAGLIREGAHAVVGYPKFDAVDWLRPTLPTLFAEHRPTVLYNPHCNKRLSSWFAFGEEVVRKFAGDPRYNLIVAPHVKLFDNRRERALAERALAPFAGLPNIHIDLGSTMSCDMTYPAIADVYLGDVSSQIYEYMQMPRPCLFLNGHEAAWEDDPNYRHWYYGPVLDDAAGLIVAVDMARADHDVYLPAQWKGLRETFDIRDQSSAARAARAVGDFVLRRARHD
jgi:hypothetical protein